MSDRKPRPKGMSCPDCHWRRMRAGTTRLTQPGVIVRYRECEACGFKCRTEERIKPPTVSLHVAEKK